MKPLGWLLFRLAITIKIATASQISTSVLYLPLTHIEYEFVLFRVLGIVLHTFRIHFIFFLLNTGSRVRAIRDIRDTFDWPNQRFVPIYLMCVCVCVRALCTLVCLFSYFYMLIL